MSSNPRSRVLLAGYGGAAAGAGLAVILGLVLPASSSGQELIHMVMIASIEGAVVCIVAVVVFLIAGMRGLHIKRRDDIND